MFVKALRVGLGQLIIFIDFITRPSKKKRPAAAQAQVESAAKGLTLYQFHACPFCVKTRRIFPSRIRRYRPRSNAWFITAWKRIPPSDSIPRAIWRSRSRIFQEAPRVPAK